MRKYFTLLLALWMAAVSCSACGGKEASIQKTDTDPSAQIADTTQDTEETGLQLNIPTEDHGGQDFHILVPTEKAYEFVTESTGEVVNDVVFQRSQKTEEHFGIRFSYQYEFGNWETRDSYNNFIKNAVLSGDSTYDVATGFVVCTLPIYMQGSLLNLMTLEDLHLDNPWWMNDQYENLNVNGQLFCAFGDANLSVYKDCSVVYFNKKVLTDFKLEDPYALVREGTWTKEKMLTMAEAVMTDLDGDTKITPTTDRIGVYGQGVPIRAFQTAFDVEIITTDENGNRIVSELTDRIAQTHEWITGFMKKPYMYGEFGPVDFYQFCGIFADNRSLFHVSFIYVLEGELMRNMDADFGIVPYPKFDEAQTQYRTQIGTSSNIVFMPKTAADPNLSCRVLEVLNYYSMLDVIPVYYTVALENKYTRDNDVPEMLALIREGMIMDFSFAYSTCFNNGFPNTILTENDINIASRMKSVEKTWTKDLEQLTKISD